MKRIFLLLLVITVLSCTDKGNSTRNISKNKPTTYVSLDSIESFEKFHKMFYNDSLSQVSRIRFPLKVILPNINISDKLDTIYWLKSDWMFREEFTDYNNVKITKENANRIIINYSGKEGGEYVDYIFIIIHGKWYLVEIIDQST